MPLWNIGHWLKVNGAVDGRAGEVRWMQLPAKAQLSRQAAQGPALRQLILKSGQPPLGCSSQRLRTGW